MNPKKVYSIKCALSGEEWINILWCLDWVNKNGYELFLQRKSIRMAEWFSEYVKKEALQIDNSKLVSKF